jgi:hypothetical protein
MEDTSMFSINPWHGRFFKIISIIGFFLIIIALIIMLSIGKATSYEFSIYDVYPWYFWLFILSATFCGQLVIIGSAITQSKKNYWLFSMCIILIINAILLFLPVIRGYYVNGSGDVLTHIGYMKDILHESNIGINHYPIDHILGVIIHLISGLSLLDITKNIPPFFSFFFIVSMFCLGKTIFKNKFELMIFILFSSILMFGNSHLAFIPNSQAYLLVPLCLFLAFKMYQGVNIKKYNILLLLMGFLIVFYHPLVTVMVMLILFLMQIMQYILEKYEKRTLKKVNYTYTILFIFAVFSIWSTYLRMATNVAQPIINRLLGEEKIQSELEKKVDLVSQVNIDPIYLIKLILNLYGQWIIIGILSLLSILLILNLIKNQKTKLNFYNGISIMGFCVFAMLSIVFLFTNGAFGFGRIYLFALLFSFLLLPSAIYFYLCSNSQVIKHDRKTIIKLLGLIFIIFCITFFSIFNLHMSPITKTANQQVPKSDYWGMSTFFSFRDQSLPIRENGISSYRFYDVIYGHSVRRVNIDFNEAEMMPPDHFGYQNETLSQNFLNNSKYLLVNDFGRDFYPHMFPEFPDKWRFLAQDYERLKMDTNIQKVYSNKNLDVFMITAQPQEG